MSLTSTPATHLPLNPPAGRQEIFDGKSEDAELLELFYKYIYTCEVRQAMTSKGTENWVEHERDRRGGFSATYHLVPPPPPPGFSTGRPAQMIHIVRRNYQRDISF